MDPELAVLAVKDKNGLPLGCMVNYACHPVDHGGGDKLSSGFPGLVCRMMKDAGYPVTIYHNGAYGNITSQDYERCKSLSMEESAESLYKSVQKTLAKISFSDGWTLTAGNKTVSLNYRNISDDEYKGKVFGAQRFRSDAMYEEFIDYLKGKIAKEKTKKVEVQVLGIGDLFYAGVPAEYFVEFQLRIKEETYPKSSFVVGGANGMAGYVPTRAAFNRGGYETTLGPPSYLAPESGDIIADTAIKIIKELGNE